jgi:signal transduction histidine kinase
VWQGVAVDLRAVLGVPFTRRAGRELLAALLTVPVVVVGFVLVVPLVAVTAVVSVTVLGLPLLASVVRGARLTSRVDRWLVRVLLRHPVTEPAPLPGSTNIVGWTSDRLRDPVGWRAVGYRALALPLLAITAVVPLMFWFYALALVTSPLWSWLVPTGSGQAVLPLFDLPAQFTGEGNQLLRWALGLLLLYCAPLVTRLTSVPTTLLVSSLLGRTALAQRVADLEAGRAMLVDDAAARLRRIERDLHDGTQAQLVALAMRLGMAKETLAAADVDLDRARELVGTAHSAAKQTLVELRDLARGILPPVLDSGLDDALGTLAARSPIAVSLDVSVPVRPPAAVETIAYFCVAELLTNVVKHSGAARAGVRVTQADDRLVVAVSDPGAGGASATAGGGLRGLADRVGAVDGSLLVNSPAGGPTVVTVELPCGS